MNILVYNPIFSSVDCQIAGEALELLVTCLTLRQNLILRFYNLPSVADFIIETLLGCPAESVRKRACDQVIVVMMITSPLKSKVKR